MCSKLGEFGAVLVKVNKSPHQNAFLLTILPVDYLSIDDNNSFDHNIPSSNLRNSTALLKKFNKIHKMEKCHIEKCPAEVIIMIADYLDLVDHLNLRKYLVEGVSLRLFFVFFNADSSLLRNYVKKALLKLNTSRLQKCTMLLLAFVIRKPCLHLQITNTHSTCNLLMVFGTGI